MVGLTILCLSLGCRRCGDSTFDAQARTVASGSAERLSASDKLKTADKPAIKELLTIPVSAYQAGLAMDAEAIYVLTDHVVHRLVSGATPVQIPVENGDRGAATRTALVYWAQGAIWQVPKTGGQARRLIALEHQPQYLMAAGDAIAWLDMPVPDHFQIQTTDGHGARTLYYWAGRIETATMDAGRVFFVRRDGPRTWRIGSVDVHGGPVAWSPEKTGTTPAKLAAAGDIFYYEMDSNEVRRLSADLSREEVLSKDLVCSPIAVAERIYCPNMTGLFDLAKHPGSAVRPLFQELRRITLAAANQDHLVWLADAGAERLSVMLVPLPVGASGGQ